MNRTSPDSERPLAAEPVWERPWSVEEIRRSSQNWSLAADAGVSGGPGAKGGTELWLPLLGDTFPPVFKGAISDTVEGGPVGFYPALCRADAGFLPCRGFSTLPSEPSCCAELFLPSSRIALSLWRPFCIRT